VGLLCKIKSKEKKVNIMAYAICRIAKQKRPNLPAVQGHNMRTIEVPHRNVEGSFNRVVGDPTMTTEELVDKQIDKLKSENSFSTIRKDAVLAVELMLSASPEYFRPNEPEKWGEYDKEKTDEWLKTTITFLEDKYKKSRIVEVTLHLDEATPHIHAIILPVVSTTKKKRRTKEQIKNGEDAKTYKSLSLSAKDLFNKSALVQLQTDYADALEPLGLERGLRGSKVSHEKSKSQYSLIHAPSIEDAYKVKYPKIESPPTFKKETWVGRTQTLINNSIDKQLLKLTESNKRLKALAESYKQRYIAEKQRTRAFWHMFDSPADAETKFKLLEEQVAELKNQIISKDEDREMLISESIESNEPLKKKILKLENEVQKLTALSEKQRLLNQKLTNQIGDHNLSL
jgi:hypothetical protein